MQNIKIKLVETPRELQDALNVRKSVFQNEQGIDGNLDFDGKDKNSDHIIVYYGDNAVGTTRIRYLIDDVAKIERTSVIKNYRSCGIGKQIIEYALSFLKEKGIRKATLNAQEHARGFYEKLGFNQDGEIFKEAGISHVKMYKKFK